MKSILQTIVLAMAVGIATIVMAEPSPKVLHHAYDQMSAEDAKPRFLPYAAIPDDKYVDGLRKVQWWTRKAKHYEQAADRMLAIQNERKLDMADLEYYERMLNEAARCRAQITKLVSERFR